MKMKKRIINNFNYYTQKNFNPLTYHDEHIPNNPFDPIKDLSYKLIGTKYSSSQVPLHNFHFNSNLTSPPISNKTDNIINEIQLSIEPFTPPNENLCHNDSSHLKRQENSIIIQEEILRLSMEKNTLIKQYDDYKQLKQYTKNQYNTINNEYNDLLQIHNDNAEKILENEGIIKDLNANLMNYYQKKKIKKRQAKASDDNTQIPHSGMEYKTIQQPKTKTNHKIKQKGK